MPLYPHPHPVITALNTLDNVLLPLPLGRITPIRSLGWTTSARLFKAGFVVLGYIVERGAVNVH